MTLAATGNNYLTQTALMRLLAVMALVIAPLAFFIPPWIALLALTVIFWRGIASWQSWALPRTSVRAALAIVFFLAIFLTFGRANSQAAGTSLFATMLALKLTEMRSRRDVTLVVFLMYFVLLTHFLFSQEIWTIVYLLLCAVSITVVLTDANHPGHALPLRYVGKNSGKLVLMAVPLMVLLFVLFPRIPGPLWGIPSNASASSSGLSDSMEPGAISELIQSNEIAFRVEFEENPPPPAQRYWRGPTFSNFDGFRWTEGLRSTATPEIQFFGAPIRYEVTLEPQTRPWLFALEMPEPDALPPMAKLMSDFQVVAVKHKGNRRADTYTSYSNYILEPELSRFNRAAALRLSDNRNPKTRDFAQNLRTQFTDDESLIAAVLRQFREQEFYYTLKPPRLGQNSVDDFLFDTRRGFCEHYASAFTNIMRAAGIPARVVTGYQGGEINLLGNYMVVRQSDAHAWSEVWLQGKGWVRIDPTGAVAPSRIERGIGETMDELGEGLSGFSFGFSRYALQYWFEARWDWINAKWNRWILGFGPEMQQELLSRFGIDSLRKMLIALTVAISLALAAVGFVSLRRSAKKQSDDLLFLEWQKILRALQKLGLTVNSAQPANEVVNQSKDLGSNIHSLMVHAAKLYNQRRYLSESDGDTVKKAGGSLASIRLKLKKSGQQTIK